MHRLLVLALLALGLTIVFAPTATPAAPGDAKGPPCSNITNGDGGYSADGVIDFTVFLQAPACSFVDYSFFVTDTSGNPVTAAATAGRELHAGIAGRRLHRTSSSTSAAAARARSASPRRPPSRPTWRISRRTRPIQRVLYPRHRSAW